MQHIIAALSTRVKQNKGSVHIEPYDNAPSPLCGLGAIWMTVGGQKYRRMFPVDDPVDCEPCRKQLEMLVRKQVQNLSAAGMEKVLDLIGGMRNGEIR